MIIKEIKELEQIINIFERAGEEEFYNLLKEDREEIYNIFLRKVYNQKYWDCAIKRKDESDHHINLFQGVIETQEIRFTMLIPDDCFFNPTIIFVCSSTTLETTPPILLYNLTGTQGIMFEGHKERTSLDWIKALHRQLVYQTFESIEKELTKPRRLLIEGFKPFSPDRKDIKVANLFMARGAMKTLESFGFSVSITNVNNFKDSVNICGDDFGGSLKELVDLHHYYKILLKENECKII